jgi:hypothetical protein
MKINFRIGAAALALVIAASGAQAAMCKFGSTIPAADVTVSTACIGSNPFTPGQGSPDANNIAGLGTFSDWAELGVIDGNTPSSAFSITGLGTTSGTWTILGAVSTETYALALKAGRNFAAYVLSGATGNWTTNALIGPSGGPQDLSNAVLFSRNNGGGGGGVPVVPLPAGFALMLTGLGAVGLIGRRKARKA